MKGKKVLALLSILGVMGFSTIAHAKWDFGIGTGPQLLKVKGDAGMNTALGPVEIEVDLDFDDIADLIDSALGFGGYATDGKWMINYKIGKLELEKEASRGLRTGATLSAKLEFDYTQAELTVGYPLSENSSYTIRGYGGLRYLRQELDILFTGTGFIGINRQKSIDESWTDALIGLSADIPFAKKWNWNIKADAGFGGSEGTYLVSTGVTWRFLKRWSATLSGDYGAVDYENGTKGSSDWYLYDVDETILGLTILFNW
jgi:hypothetical protein